jgi:hypothetical protein
MDEIIKRWANWKKNNDIDYIYDEIFEFLHLELSRSDIINLLNYAEKKIDQDS